jgi:diguanylate cyclase (GGDEF)-like protein
MHTAAQVAPDPATPAPTVVDASAAAAFDEPFVRRLMEENARLRRHLEELRPYRELAYRDALTGLWNRRFADERLREETGRVQRRVSECVAVLLVDVNGLKQINDRFGHQAGDRVIAAVGGCLTQSVRGYDACCRVGGDEFLVILPDAEAATCAMVARRIRAAVAAVHAGLGCEVAVAIGAAFCPSETLSADDLLERADAAMVADKGAPTPASPR